MSRSQGKHPRRGLLEQVLQPAQEPLTEGQERELGIGAERDIPGGLNHQSNPPVQRQEVPVPEREWPYRRAILAHGVPPDEAGHHDRDPRLSGGQRDAPRYEPSEDPGPIPVPVYIVEKAGGRRPGADSTHQKITLPAAGSEPATIVPANPARALVQLLNEDASHNARFGKLEDLTYDAANGVITNGSRLPAGASGYTVFRSQGQLFGVSETSSPVVISVITEYEIANAL